MSNIRLTLRTLLAYLDDTLPVSESRIIGAKLAENPETQELVDRIRKVIRKRSLPVPSTGADGSPSDPNTVAEYLSDALKADQLAQFEKACLDQDIHLAEVAACHQILTLVLCEQVRIPPTARQRMYQLVKGRESIPHRKPGATIPIVGVIEESEPHDTEDHDIGLLMGLQGYQKSESWQRFGLKLGVIAALVAMFGVALWMASPPSRSRDTSPAYAMLTKPTSTPPTLTPTTSTPPTLTPATSTPPTAVLPKTPPTSPAVPMPMPVPVPPDTPLPTIPIIPDPKPMPTDPPPMLNPPKKDLVPPVPAALQDRVRLGKTEDPKAIVVKKNPLADSWMRILPEDPIFVSTDRIMAMPGYKAVLLFDSGVTVNLWGNLPDLLNAPVLESAITPYLPAQGIDVDLQLHTGRIYLATKNKQGAKIVLRFRSELWELALSDDKAEIVVELFHELVSGTQDISRTTIGLAVMEGQLSLKDRYKPVASLKKGDEAQWDSKEGMTRISEATTAKLTPGQKVARSNYFSRLPLYPASTRPTLQALAEFAQQLIDPKQVRAVYDAALSNRPDTPVNDQDRAAARIAIFSFGALGDARGLGDAINDPSRGLMRQTAAQALRNALAVQPELASSFRQVLVEKNRVGDEAADAILSLLRGITPQQRLLKDTYERLVAGLGSSNVAVRELSLELLAQNYLRPDDKFVTQLLVDVGAPVEVRDGIIANWRKRQAELLQRAAEPPMEQPMK